MRTTIRLDDELLAELKQYAARNNRTLTAVIEEAVRQLLAQRERLKDRPPVQLITVDGDGPLPGVDLDDSAGLLELMEKVDDSA